MLRRQHHHDPDRGRHLRRLQQSYDVSAVFGHRLRRGQSPPVDVAGTTSSTSSFAFPTLQRFDNISFDHKTVDGRVEIVHPKRALLEESVKNQDLHIAALYCQGNRLTFS